MTEKMVKHLASLPTREDQNGTGFDAFACIVIDCDNQKPATLWTQAHGGQAQRGASVRSRAAPPFVEQRDEEAFTAIFRRHSALVLGVGSLVRHSSMRLLTFGAGTIPGRPFRELVGPVVAVPPFYYPDRVFAR